MNFNYIDGGNLVLPVESGKKYLVHVCNDVGAFGAGVSGTLGKKWPGVEIAYRERENYKLGQVQFVKVESEITVVNMIAQHMVGWDENHEPCIRYEALRKCLKIVCKNAKRDSACVNVPYLMGADLAGGKWEVIEQILKEELLDNGIQVNIYDLFHKRNSQNG